MCSGYIAHLDNVKDGAIGSRETRRTEGDAENRSWNLSQEFLRRRVNVWQWDATYGSI